MAKTLRDYQKKACRAMYDYIKGPETVPVVASLPTAAGKTLILATVAKYAGAKALMVVPNLELLKQNLREVEELGVEGVGVYSASANRKEFGEYLTIATMGSVKKLGKAFKEHGIEILYIDEAHIGATTTAGTMFANFIKDLKPKKVIGLSGTIYRLVSSMEGSKLVMLTKMRPKYFKKVIHVTQISELTSMGFWTPIEYTSFEFDESELELNSTGNDFTDDSIRRVNNELGINNNIMINVRSLISQGHKSILVFCDSVETAKEMQEITPDSACVHAKTPKKERLKAVEDFKSGKIKVMYNKAVLTTGFDYPELEVIIHGAPTNSMSLYTQIIGRGVRIHESKKVVKYLDFCGNVSRFGKVEEQQVINDQVLGWCVITKGNRVITGVPLGPEVYYHDLVKLNTPDEEEDLGKMLLGKWKNRKISEMCKRDLRYAQYMLTILDNGPLKNKVKEGVRRELVKNYDK